MATVFRGLLPKKNAVGFLICHRGIFLINWPFDARPKRRPSGWLRYRTGRGKHTCNPELGVTLVSLLQSIIPSDQHPVVHIGPYEVWQQTVHKKFTNV